MLRCRSRGCLQLRQLHRQLFKLCLSCLKFLRQGRHLLLLLSSSRHLRRCCFRRLFRNLLPEPGFLR